MAFDLRVIVVFLAMITVLVFAHELGHYLFARLFGMGVEEFSIGFGRPKLGTYYRRKYRIPLTNDEADAWERGELEIPPPEGMPSLEGYSEPGELVRDPAGCYLAETTNFTVRALPIGGFVRIRGMQPDANGKETQYPGGFFSKPPWQRLVVLFMGPLFSVLAGLALLIPYMMFVGKEALSHEPVIAYLDPESPAKKAGMELGDRIAAVDGKAISDFYQVVVAVRESAGKELTFHIIRGSKSVDLKITPVADAKPTQVLDADLNLTDKLQIQGKLLARPQIVHDPLPFSAAAWEACKVPVLTVAGLASGLFHPAELKDQVGGPVTMVRVTAEAANDGLAQVVKTAGLLSVSLGIFNLLPIFPLDGGQMLVALAEMLRRGRRLSMKAQATVATMGFSTILVMVVCVLYLDLQRLHNDNAGPSRATHQAAPAKK